MVGQKNSDESRQPLMTDIERQEERTGTAANGHPDAPIEETAQLEVEDDSSPPTPRFVQDEGNWKNWRWVPYSVRTVWTKVVKWSKGPPNPRDYAITPIFPKIQEFPLLLVEKYLPKFEHKAGLAFLYFAIWIVTFALVKRQETFATEIEGWGEPVQIGCGVTYWGSGNSCGLNGADCRPFNGSGFPFRCAANCESYQVLNPRAVGDQEIIYQPFVIGGPRQNGSDDNAIYRGDSFICGAAIHAGVISNSDGGCGVVSLVGKQPNFVGSDRHGIPSVGFDSYFPLSFTFQGGVECQAKDMRWVLLAVSVVFSTVFSLFTASPALFFFGLFTAVFWQVGLSSDPPPHNSVADLASNIIGKFLPAMMTAWVIYDKMGVRRTLNGLTAQIEKTILWLGACWFGALENYSFRWIPIQRLNKHDLEQQPGAKAALFFIIAFLLVIIGTQVYFFRQEGRLRKYLKLYILFILGIVVCLVLPDLNLRIHHYILALLLLPGTSMQTRPVLLYQSLLVGLFINGIARWGFDPVLQTSAALQGDAQHNSALPIILAPTIQLGATLSNITFKWDEVAGKRYDGISILVNDVERFRSYFDEDFDGKDNFLWAREGEQGLNEYFRFGYMEGTQTWDYTKAGIWNKEGAWIEMPPGPSKVRRWSFSDEDKVPSRR
jgi:hypothetical protein